MHRFFVSPDCISGNSVEIDAKLAHRLKNVLRLRGADTVVMLDSSGFEYEVELDHGGASGLQGVIKSRKPGSGEPRTKITLFQSLLKGAGFEYVLQKCTEVGVTSFIPVLSERCVARSPAPGRVARWNSILLEAAEQSGRGRLPSLHPVIPFVGACKQAGKLAVLPWEEEKAVSLGTFLENVKAGSATEVSIFIGPEGGFSPREVELAGSHGITAVSMGSRIFKAETAGLIAAAITLYSLGDLGAGESPPPVR